jgi:hypothetical protein
VRRQRWGNVDLLNILALLAKDFVPFVDKRPLGGVFRNRADLVLREKSSISRGMSNQGCVTHSSFLDFVGKLDEKLLVLRCILATDEDLDREASAFDLIEMFCYEEIKLCHESFEERFVEPFFAVVRM